MDLRDLRGRSALVTGAASGIGTATALACARRGASLVLCDVDEAGLAEVEREIRALGRDVLARRVDVGAPISPDAWGMYYASRIAPGLLRWVNDKLAGRISAGP